MKYVILASLYNNLLHRVLLYVGINVSLTENEIIKSST